jgi:hypothetical protein
VFAWKDLDRDGEVTAGDLLGAYAADGENVTPLAPPAADPELDSRTSRADPARAKPAAPNPWPRRPRR